jgi:hypothetical protein
MKLFILVKQEYRKNGKLNIEGIEVEGKKAELTRSVISIT